MKRNILLKITGVSSLVLILFTICTAFINKEEAIAKDENYFSVIRCNITTSSESISISTNEMIIEKPVIEWASIPAGTFTMGSPDNEKTRGFDETEHLVTLTAFKICKYEVTFEQYDLFCEITRREKPNDEGMERGKCPVINVSWEDAKAFADWMGCRLPTEAEWEYACRAGTKTPFNTGKKLATSQANYDGTRPYKNRAKGDYKGTTWPVGSFPANAFGLCDMHGNVSEWCFDWYGDYPTETQTNPKGPSSGTFRVTRGGSWNDGGNDCRSACRSANSPTGIASRDPRIGFRLVAIE